MPIIYVIRRSPGDLFRSMRGRKNDMVMIMTEIIFPAVGISLKKRIPKSQVVTVEDFPKTDIKTRLIFLYANKFIRFAAL